jgi:hypothetical protein
VEKGEVEETGEVGEDDSVVGVVKGVSTWRGDEVEEMELVIGETGEDNLAKGEKNLFIEHHMSTDVHPGRHLSPVRRITQRNTG